MHADSDLYTRMLISVCIQEDIHTLTCTHAHVIRFVESIGSSDKDGNFEPKTDTGGWLES